MALRPQHPWHRRLSRYFNGCEKIRSDRTSIIDPITPKARSLEDEENIFHARYRLFVLIGLYHACDFRLRHRRP